MVDHEVWSSIDVAAAVDETKSRLLEEAIPGMGVFAHFARHIGHADDDDFDPRQDPDLVGRFEEFLTETAEDAIREQIARLQYDVRPVDGELTVYRGVVVPSAWDVDGLSARPLGVCWSWDQRFAVPYSFERAEADDLMVRLTGKVDVSGVDWTLTLALNAVGEFNGEDEKEIRLQPDAVVSVHQVEARPFDGIAFRMLFDLEGRAFPVAEPGSPASAP